jgi:predicted Fe-Mo cluster-binding NifX family protein
VDILSLLFPPAGGKQNFWGNWLRAFDDYVSIQGEIMKIAVSAQGPNLEAQVDPRFGRAPYFLLVDTETLGFDLVPNPASMQTPQGAGIQAAAMVARHRPAAVLTGNCGPKAFQTLQAAGIQVIVGVEGQVRDAVQKYQAGILKPARESNVASHWR